MTFHIPLYAAALGAFLLALQIGLMVSVGVARFRSGVNLGDGDDPGLQRVIRRHANLAENAGVFLVAITLLEILVGQTTLVLAIAIGFAAARIFHATSFLSLSGSHLIQVDGAQRVFPALRAAGAGLTALSGISIVMALVWSVMNRI